MAEVRAYNSKINLQDWAYADEGHVFESIFPQLESQAQHVMGQEADLLRAVSSYLGRSNGPYNSFLYPQTYSTMTSNINNLTDNIISSGIDTLVAKISRLEIMPKAITNKATAEGREIADNINYIINGLYNKYNIKQKIIDAYRDAFVWRNGYFKICIDDKDELLIDRMYINEAEVDPIDGYYNNPYKIIQKKIVPKSVLLRTKGFEKFRKKIDEVAPLEMRCGTTDFVTIGIPICEAWCKNSYKDKGRHVICISTADLLDENWDYDYLPIIKAEFQPPIVGDEGNSVVDILYTMQQEINRLMSKAQRILKRLCSPKILIDTRSSIDIDTFTNDIGEFIKYDGGGGNSPAILNGAAMPPEIQRMIEYLVARSLANLGLTVTDTQGMKPMGVESGEALKTMTDIASERWAALKMRVEQTHVQTVDMILKTISGKDIKIPAIDNKIGLKIVNTRDLPKDANSYVIQTFPISALPSDPAGRIDTIEKYVKLGVVQPQQVPEFFNMPDLGEYTAIEGAPRQLAQKNIEKMIREKTYIAPEIYDDLQSYFDFAQRYYAFEKINAADETVLKLLRRFMSDCLTAMKLQQEEINNASNAGQQQPGTSAAGNPGATSAPGQQQSTPGTGGQPAAA